MNVARLSSVVCLIMLFAMPVLGTETTLVQLSPETSTLLHEVLRVREEKFLVGLTYDVIQSSIVESYLPEILAQQAGVTADSVLVVDLDRYIPDWNKTCLLCTGASLDEITDKLLADVTFKKEVYNPIYTHLVVSAAADSLGRYIAVVCLIQRLIHFSPHEMTIIPDGPTFLTLSGRAPSSSSLRFTFYKHTGAPDEYTGSEIMSRDVSPLEDGSFRITLPISKFGRGEYRVAVYATQGGSQEAVLAALLECRVQ